MASLSVCLSRTSAWVSFPPPTRRLRRPRQRNVVLCSLQTGTNSHQHDSTSQESRSGQGWTDASGNLDERLLARFRGLALMASDRVELHTILAHQRSNWNDLFHSTITIAAVSAAAAAAMNGGGGAPGLGLTLVATSLNLVCAAFMVLVNTQQPSQLAEEQLRAARFFKRLAVEVEATLQIDPSLREEAWSYWEDKVATLHTLDEAFPLPLSPNGLEKFPKQVVPAELSAPFNEAKVQPEGRQNGTSSPGNRTGWTTETEDYLKQTLNSIRTRDVPVLIGIANKAKNLNQAMAKTSPLFAAAAAACNIVNIMPFAHNVAWLAAALTVGALFTHSVSHALQLGCFFEVCRNHAGYYAEIETAIQKALHLPPHMREDWALFLQKINLQLGHDPSKQTFHLGPAGKLF